VAYSTEADVRLAWNGVTTVELPKATVDKAITKADGEIDAKLNCIYPVPFSAPVPAIINGISMDIALFYCKMWKDPRLVVDADGKLEMNYNLAMERLEEIRDGKMDIPGVNQRQLCKSTREDNTAVFGEDGMLNAKLDEDLKDKIEDSRD